MARQAGPGRAERGAGRARRGMAWRGEAGEVGPGAAWHGVAWRGRRGRAWCGVARRGTARQGSAWRGMAWQGKEIREQPGTGVRSPVPAVIVSAVEGGTAMTTATPRKAATRTPKVPPPSKRRTTLARIPQREGVTKTMSTETEAPAAQPGTDVAVNGEVVDAEPMLNEAEARALTDEINSGVSDVESLIKRAFDEQAYKALGHETWDAYCDTEIHTAVLGLPRQKKKEMVGSLRDAGWSIPAIASATGLSKSGVGRDAKQGSQNGKPAGRTKGRDGKSYPSKGKVTDRKPKAKAKSQVLTVERPAQNISEFPDDTVGFGTMNLGAVALDGNVHWYVDGEPRLLHPDVARKFASCLLAAAEATA